MKHHLFLLIWTTLLLLQFSCNQTGSRTETAEKIKITNEGVDINYNDTKAGDTTLLFVHGWCINKGYWENQAGFFRSKYRVVAIDLPGFGASGKNRKHWTVEAYGKDLSAVMEQLDLKNVVLVGHSMSGQIIVETALHNKDRVIGLVGVDNFKHVTYEDLAASDTAAANFYKAARQNYKAVVLPSAREGLFSSTTDSLIKQQVLNDIAGADPEIALASLEQCDRYPGGARLASLKRRLYLINSDVSPTDTTALSEKGIQYILLSIHATGHYPMVEKPAEFNALLVQVMEKIKEGGR